jgi:uncharacterized repeat protein (TIGR02543 family)
VGTLPTAPTKTGYTFTSWNTKANGSGTKFKATTAVTADITVYAQWTTNTYTVTFNENGGDTEADPITKSATHGGNVGTLPTEPTRADYIFTSWNTEANGSGTEFTAATAVTANLTVYAQWTSSDATLSDLSLSSGTLVPTFASATTSYTASVANNISATTSYTASVANNITSITVTPTATDTNATITVNTTPVASGSVSGAISLNVGENTITIVVTAEDGTTTKTYTVTVTRETEPITAIGAITGKVREGDVLTAGALTPADATADYQWQICATVDGTYTNITEATSTTYTPVVGDVTKFIKVVATGTGGYSGTVTSAATVEVVAEGTCVAGDSYGGGIVAYRLQFGDPDYDSSVQHGLIAAIDDQSTEEGIIWAIEDYQNTEVEGTLLTIGSGSANTDKIIAQNGVGITYAAGLARAHDGGDYTDWFLPSKDELNKLYINKVEIGGFPYAGNYWSSSEYNATNAWSQNFYYGYQHHGNLKTSTFLVRAVRAF